MRFGCSHASALTQFLYLFFPSLFTLFCVFAACSVAYDVPESAAQLADYYSSRPRIYVELVRNSLDESFGMGVSQGYARKDGDSSLNYLPAVLHQDSVDRDRSSAGLSGRAGWPV